MSQGLGYHDFDRKSTAFRRKFDGMPRACGCIQCRKRRCICKFILQMHLLGSNRAESLEVVFIAGKTLRAPSKGANGFCVQWCLRRSLCAAQGVPRAREGAFFFTKKAYCGNQTFCVAESRKSVQTQPHPFSALKKALQIMGIQGESLPLGRRLAGSKPAALTLGQSPRGLSQARQVITM